jgi:hypothetical protein
VSDPEEQTRAPEQIEAEIERTRGELADTVEALAAKTDVKAQAKAKVADAKDSVQAKAEDAVETVSQDRRPLYAAVAATVAAVVVVGLVRRRR